MTNVFSTPRIVTYDALVQSVWPHISDYDWAINALDELWRMSTPTPESARAAASGLPFIEKRILYPSLFAQWWADVQQRRGIATPLDKIIPAR